MNLNANMAQEEMVPIQYLVFCGNHTRDGLTYQFKHLSQAPASLCIPRLDNESGPDPDATGALITSLVDAHHNEILTSRAWQCITCGQPATELLHSAVPMLSPVTDRATADFKPSVIDNAAPICISGGECDRNALRVLQEFARSALVQRPWQMVDTSNTCDKCGRKTGVMLCGGCKLIAYCSKECQRQSWPSHKRQCRLAQAAVAQGS